MLATCVQPIKMSEIHEKYGHCVITEVDGIKYFCFGNGSGITYIPKRDIIVDIPIDAEFTKYYGEDLTGFLLVRTFST